MPDFSKWGSSNEFSLPSNPTSLCYTPSLVWYQQPIHVSAGTRILPFGFLSLINTLGMVGRALGYPVKEYFTPTTIPAPLARQTIIASHDAQHSSTLLCADPQSRGPDFVSFVDGVFCDMTGRRSWPLCNSTAISGCYDWQSHTFVDGWLRKREMGYSKVIKWK